MAPSSTYRLQFSKDQTFTDAVGPAPLPRALGVGALYASPLLESGAGSNHGYDVVDPTRVSAERGGEAGRRALVDAVRARGLQFLLDIVPNHVGVDVPQVNPWWWDVLRLGQESRVRRVLRHRLVAARSCCPSSARTRRRPLSELSLSDDRTGCATTSTGCPSRPAPATAPRRRCTSASTTGWCPGSAAPPS